MPSPRCVPTQNVVSLYIVGASQQLKRGMPFHRVGNFEHAWPLRFTIPLGGVGINITGLGLPVQQGVSVMPWSVGADAKELSPSTRQPFPEPQRILGARRVP